MEKGLHTAIATTSEDDSIISQELNSNILRALITNGTIDHPEYLANLTKQGLSPYAGKAFLKGVHQIMFSN
ncbi:MAG: hypothetical protein NTX76_03585 [Alphaproteobacteria bacterium]|nr:hypothetical protein [Alphaproteobacteria bacterium]